MKTRIVFMTIILIVLASTTITVMAAGKKGGYLGKYTSTEVALGDVITFPWAVQAAEPPLWSVYRDDRETGDGFSGLFHCSGAGCWAANSTSELWLGELYLNPRDFTAETAYLICAETAYGSATFETWTFRISDDPGNRPPAKPELTACP